MSAGAVFGTIKCLAEQIAEETSFQYALSDKIEELIEELERTQAFLEDAEQKQRGERRIRKWIHDVRDISYSLEDVLEKYSLVVEKRRHQKWVLRYACIFKFLVKRHQIGTSIDHLQKRIEGISRSRSTYGIDNLGETNRQNKPENEDLRRQRRLNASQEDFSFVGLKNDLKILKDRLLDTKEKRRCCISVVGMGGLGKTTIARKVFQDVKTYFDISVWVYISEEFQIKDVLEKIRNQITWYEQEKDEEELGREINKRLKGKRFLVVLDDVWVPQLWQNLRSVFPDENNGSRLLLTTRNEEVARYVDPITSPHNLRLLDIDESWELFCQIALLIPREDPEVLLDLGKEITQKCVGLPLAIVVLGGLLSRKPKQTDSWERVLDRITSVLNDSPERCKAILAMSYDDIPFNVKPCFLYFGLFPADSNILAKRLIHLWVAENLVQVRLNEKLEDEAEDCLEELISRNLVQVAKRKRHGAVRHCRIHDLLRDLAIEEAAKENFLHTRVKSSVNVRRLSIQSEVVEEREVFNLYTNRLRSLFLSSIYKGRVEELIPKMQLLRVLDMTRFPLKQFPEEINQLIHLRYLGLNFNLDQSDRFSSYNEVFCVKCLNPSVSLSNLKHLQTLRSSGHAQGMSDSIWTLHQLRHLYGRNLFVVGDVRDQRIDRLKNLQTLQLQAGNWINSGLENLSDLRELRIYGTDLGKYHEGLSKALKKLLHLRLLGLIKCSQNDLRLQLKCTYDGRRRQKSLKLPSLSHLRCLTKMTLYGRLETLPEFPPNLVELKLVDIQLEEGIDLSALQNLKELKFLKLSGSIYEGNEINIFCGGFPKLEEVQMKYVVVVKRHTLNVEEGALRTLKRLVIRSRNLEHIPEGLKYLRCLRELEIRGVSNELFDRVKIGGEDWDNIKHVPSISISSYGNERDGVKTWRKEPLQD